MVERSRDGSGWRAAALPALPLAIGLIIAGTDFQSSGSLSNVGWMAIGLICLWLIVILGSCVWAIGNIRRRRYLLASRPDGIAVDSLRSAALLEQFATLIRAAGVSTEPLPHSLTLFVSAEGAEIWGGWIGFTQYCSFPWSEIADVSTVVVDQSRWRAISLSIRASTASDVEVALPIVALGGGPFGAFAMPRGRFAEVVASIQTVGDRS